VNAVQWHSFQDELEKIAQAMNVGGAQQPGFQPTQVGTGAMGTSKPSPIPAAPGADMGRTGSRGDWMKKRKIQPSIGALSPKKNKALTVASPFPV
jgi:hypothetical protein